MPKAKYEKWLTEDGLVLLEAWARSGLDDKSIAKKCGVSTTTLYAWKNSHKPIGEALRRGKEVVDSKVESALLKKCLGYYVPEEQAFKCKKVYYDKKGRRCEKEEIKTVTVQKYIPPETIADLAWLNNRCSDQWRRNAGKEKLDEKRFEHEKEVDKNKYF